MIQVGDTVEFIDKEFNPLHGRIGVVINIINASEIQVDYSPDSLPDLWFHGIDQVKVIRGVNTALTDERDYYSHLTGDA